MKTISNNILLDKLKTHLLRKGYSLNMLKENFPIHIGTTTIVFDLIVVDNQEPVEIYEIRHKLDDISSTRNYIKLKAQKGLLSKIPAFIAYIKGNGHLCLLPMQNKIKSFQEFYATLMLYTETCADEYLYFYRGHNDISYSFYPGIYRLGDNKKKDIKNEDTMFNDAIRYCPNDFTNSMTSFEKLVKMQHYELPTRLLDITTNPLVALYFACTNNNRKDGEVVIFKVKRDNIKYFNSDIVSVISNISKRPVDFKVDVNLDKVQFNQQEHIQRLIHDIRQEKPYFNDSINPTDLNKVVCVLPKLDNPRIARQNGAFFLFGINGAKAIPADFDYAPKRIIIDHEVKLKILQELKNIGIDHATLFPEINNIMKKIKETK